MAKDKRSGRPHLDPDAVIASRGRALTARELVALIREVNPSGRDLPARETARRYAQKSRLQSLLVRRFADDLVVEPDPREPGVVGLRYRPLDALACHAVVTDLDDDARAIVERRIDLGDDDTGCAALHPRTVPPGGSEEPSATELLRAGEEAIAAYDYESARAHLDQAMVLAPGDGEIAAALLSLLVDHLAADEEALALGERLPPAALRASPVRLLLALAATRAGASEWARHLIAGERSGAEVLVALGRASLERGDLDGAARDLAEARRRDPAHAGIAPLDEALERARAAERQPMEAALEGMIREERLHEAEAQARSILARWPESDAGRRALRTVEERRRTGEARHLLAAGEAALGNGEHALAISLLHRALAAGLPEEDAARARARREEIEARARERAEHDEDDAVVRLLHDEDLVPGLVAYAAMQDRARRRVREAVSLPHLGWMDEIGVHGAGARARAAALAASALHHAAAIVATEPGAALEILGAHGKLLAGVEEHAGITAEARRRLCARRHDEAARRLSEAAAVLAGGDAERAEALFAAIAPGDLDENWRAHAGDLGAALERAREDRRLRAAFTRHRREGALLRARDDARAMHARSEGDERARWEAIDAELSAEIRGAFRVTTDRTPVQLRSLADVGVRGGCGIMGGILPGTMEMVFIQTHGCWLFLHRVDVARKLVLERVIMRTPVPIDGIGDEIFDDRIVIVDKYGAVLELALTGGEVLAWHDLAMIDREATRVHFELDAQQSPRGLNFDVELQFVKDFAFAPGSRLLTTSGLASRTQQFIRVMDLDRRRMVREVRETVTDIDVDALDGLATPLVAVRRRNPSSLAFHDASGTPVAGPLPLDTLRDAVLAYPGREEILQITGRQPRQQGSPSAPLRCRRLTLGGAVLSEQLLDGLGDRIIANVATDSRTGMVYLIAVDEDHAPDLLGLQAQADGTLIPMFRVPMPAHAALFTACDRPAVWISVCGEEDVPVIELGVEPPALPPASPIGILPDMMDMTGYHRRCHEPTGRRRARVTAAAAELRQTSRATWSRVITDTAEQADVERILALGSALSLCGASDKGNHLENWCKGRFPDHPAVRVEKARALADLGRWAEVRALLHSVDPGALDDGCARHLCHLLGLALVWLGEHEEALCVAQRGLAFSGGRCDLEALIALATPLSATEPRAWKADARLIRDLLRAVTDADACLARGDAAGARDAMSGRVMAETFEVQSLARRAEACLGGAEPAGAGCHEKALALASFCDAHADKCVYSRTELPMPLPGGTWDKVRLDALAQRATAWLDATLGAAWPWPAKI